MTKQMKINRRIRKKYFIILSFFALLASLIVLPGVSAQVWQQAGLERYDAKKDTAKQPSPEVMTSQQLEELKAQKMAIEREREDLMRDMANLSKINSEFQPNPYEIESLKDKVKSLKQENTGLKQRIALLESDIAKESARLYQELGTAYTQAKVYDYAIDAFTKSISFNPDNADVYYNLGLLYKHFKNDSRKAVYFFRRYIVLKPDAKNRKDVEFLINMLTKK